MARDEDDRNPEGEGRAPDEADSSGNGHGAGSLVSRLDAIAAPGFSAADGRVSIDFDEATSLGRRDEAASEFRAASPTVADFELPKIQAWSEGNSNGNGEVEATVLPPVPARRDATNAEFDIQGSTALSDTDVDTSSDVAEAEEISEPGPEIESESENIEHSENEASDREEPVLANGAGHANGSANGAGHVNGRGTEESDAADHQADSSGANGSNGGGHINGGGGGGSNGAGGPARLERRFRDQDFREVLGKGLATCRRNLVIVGIFSFIVNVLVLAIPIYLFNISDRVLTSQSIDTLMMLTIIVAGAILMHVLLDMARRFILMRIAVEIESKLGAPVLSAAAKASQNGSSREFQTLADLQHLRSFTTSPVLISMLDAPVAPVYLLAIFLIHPHLGFIVCGTGAVLLFMALLNQKLTAVPFGRANAFATRANLQADAMARNAQVMNAMGMIPEGVLIWGRETAESLTSQVVAQDRNIVLAGVSKFVRLCTQIGILGWGAWLAIAGELTGGMIIAASIVGSRALTPIEGTIEGWRNFVQARSAYARIKALLHSSPLNFERLRLPRPRGHLSVERVLYVPPPNKKVILNGVTFDLEPGESLAIVGASGAGKSTLGKMLVGSIFPTAGNVRLDMMDLRNWDPRQFGESVGYLPQDVQLFPASIKENIARMRKEATDAAIFDAAELADVHGMISEFAQGYETQVAMDGSPLSGGQKQRIGLARAFFGDPRLVVLDEPNSNLDTPGEYALANALVCAKRKEITVVAITQRPSLLRSVDKIMILKNGTVQAVGKRDDIIPLITSRKGADGGRLNGGAALPEA